MVEEEIKKEQSKQEKLPIREPQPTPNRYYLLVVDDGESQETLVIKERNILLALSKFAKEYEEVCGEWLGLNISIEEINALE